MFSILFKPLSVLPLPVLHALGYLLGLFLYLTDRKSKKRAMDNIKQSQLCNQNLHHAVKQNFINLGQAAMETPYIWRRSQSEIGKLTKSTTGWEHVENAKQHNKGIIFLTPHMGCFEIASLYCGLHQPITVLYRKPKQKWIVPLMEKGRAKEGISLAEANTQGVRKLVKTLKKGGAIGILPDQIPAAGEGEWADFFGKPAYTMTLASKLAEKTGATILMVFGERLPCGKGYRFNVSKVDSINTPRELNQALEAQIAQCPDQYYWHYNRYKISKKGKADLEAMQSD